MVIDESFSPLLCKSNLKSRILFTQSLVLPLLVLHEMVTCEMSLGSNYEVQVVKLENGKHGSLTFEGLT